MNAPGEIAAVEIDLKSTDYQAFLQYALRRSRLQKSIPWLIIGAGALLGIISGTISGITGREVSEWIGFNYHGGSFLLGAFFAFFLLIIASRVQMRALAPNEEGPLLGQHTLSIRSDGLFDTTKHGNSALYWTAVRDTAETLEHYFVMSDRNYGHIIPKRSFATAEEGKRFISELKARMIQGASD